MPNISQLDDTAFSVDSLRIEGGPVTMKLGGHEFTFEDGQWVVGAFNYLIHIVSDLLLDHVPLAGSACACRTKFLLEHTKFLYSGFPGASRT